MASSIPGSGVSTLFITNLPRITDADFTQLFSQSGCVSSRLETDRAGNQVGYVDFPDEAAAMTARNFYSGWKVGGENGPGLSLELATTFPSGGSGAGQQGGTAGGDDGRGGKRPRSDYYEPPRMEPPQPQMQQQQQQQPQPQYPPQQHPYPPQQQQYPPQGGGGLMMGGGAGQWAPPGGGPPRPMPGAPPPGRGPPPQMGGHAGPPPQIIMQPPPGPSHGVLSPPARAPQGAGPGPGMGPGSGMGPGPLPPVPGMGPGQGAPPPRRMNLPPNASSTLYVEGVPKDATVREMSHVFRPFEGFQSTRLVAKEGIRGPLCFSEFADPGLAFAAMETLQGYLIDRDDPDSPCLRISFAKHQPHQAGRGGGGRGGGRRDERDRDKDRDRDRNRAREKERDRR